MRPKILLIDDDKSLLDMYALKFRIDGSCDLITSASPENVLNIAEREQPDLILLDLVLPKTEQSLATLNQEVGFGLLKSLKSNIKTESIPVIIFTNLDEKTKDNSQRALFLGAYDYWIKAHWLPGETVEKVKDLLKLFQNWKRRRS